MCDSQSDSQHNIYTLVKFAITAFIIRSRILQKLDRLYDFQHNVYSESVCVLILIDLKTWENSFMPNSNNTKTRENFQTKGLGPEFSQICIRSFPCQIFHYPNFHCIKLYYKTDIAVSNFITKVFTVAD